MAYTRSQAGKLGDRPTMRAATSRPTSFHSKQATKKARSHSNTAAKFTITRPTISATRNNRRRSHNMSPGSRRAELESDPWVVPGSVQPGYLVCKGCCNPIKMDNRGEYYIGFWDKHKKRCKTIKMNALMEEYFYTAAEAEETITEEKSARLRYNRVVKKQVARQDSDEEQIDMDDNDVCFSDDTLSTLSHDSLQSIPSVSSSALPGHLGRKEFHLNPLNEDFSDQSCPSLSMLADAAAFAFMQEGFSAVSL